MNVQKQHDFDDDADKPKGGQLQDDPAARAAAQKAKELLNRLDQKAKQKKGHWEMCCGVRRWVED